MNDSPKIKEHDDMSQRKNAKAVPFQWKTILCDATGYYKKTPKCFVVTTTNSAGSCAHCTISGAVSSYFPVRHSSPTPKARGSNPPGRTKSSI